jgi:hypothetical protein
MTKRIFYSRYGLVAQSQEYIPVVCKTCGIEWKKLKTTLKEWKGNCRSCAQKEAKADPQTKKKMSESARQQVLAQGGIPNAKKFTKGSTAKEKNWRWIKNRSQINTPRQKRSVFEYVEWRNLVFERDNYICQKCGQRGGKLNAHHIKPFSKYPELIYDVSNGITLCLKCHKETDTFGGRANRYETGRTAAMVA